MDKVGVKALTALIAGGEGINSAFRSVMESLPVATYITDAQGRLTYYNSAAVKLSGRLPEIGTEGWCGTWKIFLADGTLLPHDQSPMAVALRGGVAPTGIECVAERPDGTRFWFTPCPAVLRDPEGQIIGGIHLLVDITDRKHAEIEATEQFRAIVETTPECVKMVAADGTLLFMNPPGLTMVGASLPEDVIGKSVYDLIAPEHRERFREFNEAVCRGDKASLEFDIIGLNGGRCQMETRAVPLSHVDGTTVQLAITRNIGDRKQAERAALLLSAIVDSSDDAIVSKDLDGIITSWNKGAERLFGYAAAETVGQPVTILIPRDRLDEEPDILARLRRGERVDHYETKRQRKDGTLLDISLTISPVKDSRGTIIGASKIARDISTRKQTEAALRASEAKFRQLADSMPQIIWTAQADGSLDYFNERWYDFSGFARDTHGDLSWIQIVHPEDAECCRDTWYASVHTGKPFSIESRFWDRRQNRWRWFMGRALPVRDEGGKIVKWFGSCTDIDAQKRVEDELRRANDDLEQFAFSASHDLQEPLRSVKIYSEILANSYGNKLDSRALECLGYLRSGASRMETLLRDLLTYTQVINFDKPTEVAEAGDALVASLANLSGMVSETGAQITADPLPAVCVHTAHLQQLFQNLIGNAIKYRSAARPPVVHITAELKNGRCLFAVADNGIGIDPAYRETIFGLFKRLHTSDEYSGTGIGLAICQRVVDRYHGRIWVESKPGEGSIFYFTLPI